MAVGSGAGSVGTGERRMRRRPAAGGAELGLLFEEEKAAALAAGEARRWRSNGSHGSIESGVLAAGRERGNSCDFVQKRQTQFRFSIVEKT
jgi:hypothetical protein